MVGGTDFVFGRVAVIIKDTGNANLLVGGASFSVGAVGIENTLNAHLLGNGAGRLSSDSGAFSIDEAHMCFLTEAVGALGLCGFSSSPAVVWAVGVGSALGAATTFLVTVWEAVVFAVDVFGTEVDADSIQRVAVRLGNDLTAVRDSARFTRLSAIVTGTVGSAVGGFGRAIGVLGARSADTSGSVADWLSWDLTSIEGSTVGRALAVNARFVGLTVGELGVSGTTNVSGATERVDTDTGSANGVGTSRGRSIVGNTVSVVGAGTATSILVTVLSRWASSVRGTRGFTKLGGSVTDSLSSGFTSILGPGCVNTVGVGTAVEADTVTHAVSTLGSGTLSVGGASARAKARGLDTVDLVLSLTSVERSAVGRSV